MSGPENSSPDMPEAVAATTSSFEEQVILDLQTRLTKLAQQNRESIAKALSSAAEASDRASPPSQTSKKATSPPETVSKPTPKNASSRRSSSDSTLTASSTRQDPNDVHGIVPHLLTQSLSSPACTAPSTDPLTVSAVGGDQHYGHSAEEISVMGQPKRVLKDITRPELHYMSHLANRELLENQLEDTKARVFHLDSKLKECNEICEQQKLHFRTALVDLQTKLNNTIVGRNSVLDLRRQEAESQERLVNQLQRTFADVEISNQQQAQVLQDASSKISSLYTELQSCNTALAQVITLAVGHTTKRGLTLHHKTNYSGPVDSEQVIGVLTEVLEYYEKEIGRMENKIGKVEIKLVSTEEEFTSRWQQNGEEHKQMLRKLREEQEAQLSAATERALNARKQTLSLQSQLTLVQEQLQKQLDTKTSHVTELQVTLRKTQEDAEVSANTLQAKCETLSSDLKKSQQQQTTTAEEKSQLQDQVNGLEQQLHSTKESVAKAEIDFERMRLQNDRVSSLEEESNVRLNDLTAQLAAKTRECQQLGRMVEEVRGETTREAEQRIVAANESNRQCITSLTNDLTAQINDMTHKYNMALTELERKENESQEMRISNENLTRNLAMVRQDLQQLGQDKMAVVQAGEEKDRGVENLRTEKKQLMVLVEERNHEISFLQNARDQLQVQVTEKDEQCTRLQEQTSGMTQLAEVTRKAGDDWKWERSQMNEMLEKQAKELQDLKMLQEGLNRKLKIREKRLRNVEEENKKLQEVVQGTTQESESVFRSKEEMRSELQQTKTQLDLSTIEIEKLKAESVEKEQNHRRDISKQSTMIQSLQREIWTAHTTIQATTTMDGKAVKVAENMQKEVTAKRGEIDGLQTEIHWLKESLDITKKEKTAMAGERDHYRAQVSQAKRSYDNLKKEQETINSKKSEQSFLVTKLEDTLKKATSKHAECKAIIERQEQDIARLKLEHQLELKELERAKNHLSPKLNLPLDQLGTSTEKTTSMAYNVQSLPKKDNEAQSILNKIKTSDEVFTQTHTETTQHAETVTKKQRFRNEQQHVDLSQPAVHLLPATHRAAALDQVTRTSRHEHHETKTSLMEKQFALKDDLTRDELTDLLIDMYTVVKGRPRVPRKSYTLTGIPEMSKNTRKEPGYDSMPSKQYHNTATFCCKITPPMLTLSPVKDEPPASPVTDSGLYSFLGPFSPRFELIPEADFLPRPSSPVSSLLGVGRPFSADEDVHQSNESWNNNGQVDPVATRRSIPTAISACDDTKSENRLQSSSSTGDVNAQQEQVKLLQDKLQRLSRLGDHLQKENKDMATLIKKQDSRLRKCRKEEESVQHLVKKTR